MKSIGNGWKRAQEARRRAWTADAEIRANAQREKVHEALRRQDLLYDGAISFGSGGFGACFDKHGNMTQSKPVYADSQGFDLDAARAVREGLINPPLPRSKPTTWQRFKNWLA